MSWDRAEFKKNRSPRDPAITFNEFRLCGKAIPIHSRLLGIDFILAADNAAVPCDEFGLALWRDERYPLLRLSEFAALRERHDFRTEDGRQALLHQLLLRRELGGTLLTPDNQPILPGV
jgi:hypothetical protein